MKKEDNLWSHMWLIPFLVSSTGYFCVSILYSLWHITILEKQKQNIYFI